MTDHGTMQAQPDPKGELAVVIAQLAEHGITLSISDAGTVLVSGYDKDNPDHAGILVANRELINRHLVPQPIGDGTGLDTRFNPHAARSAAPSRRPARIPADPEEIARQRAAHKARRRREIRAALDASEVPLVPPPVELPQSGPGVLLGPATIPAFQVAAQARAERQALRERHGGPRTVPIIHLPEPL